MSIPQRTKRTIPAGFIFFVLVIGALIVAGSFRSSMAAESEVMAQPVIQSSAVLTTTQSYLPLLIHKYNLPPNIFGVQMDPYANAPATLADQAGFAWVRRNGLFWNVVQPNATSGYLWTAVASLEQELARANQDGMETILVVRATPPWAQLYPGYPCGPMKQSNFDEFGAFLAAAVTRYSGPPYYVEYFEIWNEPDVDRSLVDPNEVYGCWGDNNDPYYGGGYYGQMLKVVYPMMKAANPNVKVLVGGLLLDCDPRNPPAGETCKPSLFLDGMLLAGAKNSFDGVSYHAYDYYNWNFNTFGNPNWSSGKFFNEPNGVMSPVSSKKVDYIEQVLANRGATGKFLMNTESALICGGANDPPGLPGCDATDTSPYELMKKAFATQAYVTSFADGLRTNIWYSMRGWRNSGLIYQGGVPRPAYYSIEYAVDQLAEAVYVRTLMSFTDATGVVFTTPAYANLWVMWSTDGAPQNVTLPAVPLAIKDSTGGTVPVTGTTLTLQVEPYYIQMP